jgi:hypothetical protein
MAENEQCIPAFTTGLYEYSNAKYPGQMSIPMNDISTPKDRKCSLTCEPKDPGRKKKSANPEKSWRSSVKTHSRK